MIKAVLFDFDGVLGDSYGITLLIFQEVFRKYNFPLPTDADLIPHRGRHMLDTIKALLPENHDVDLQEMLKYTRDVSFNLATKVKLMPHARKTIEDLKKKYTLAIVTSRRNRTVLAILDHHKITEHFKVLIDFDGVKNPKPDPEGVLKALDMLGLQKNEVIFVGDAKEDVDAAKSAGVISILYGKENTHNADYHITSLKELAKILDQL